MLEIGAKVEFYCDNELLTGKIHKHCKDSVCPGMYLVEVDGSKKNYFPNLILRYDYELKVVDANPS